MIAILEIVQIADHYFQDLCTQPESSSIPGDLMIQARANHIGARSGIQIEKEALS